MIGAAVKLGLTAFGAAGLLTKLIVVGTLAMTLLTAYGVWHHSIYQSGVNDTLAAIARADAKTIARASAARNAWKNCRDLGKQWDQSTGRCS